MSCLFRIIAVTILFAICLLCLNNVYAKDFTKMTKEEKDAYFAKINAASADDHKKMMELLHITSLRPGVNGNDPNAVITIQVENEIGMLPRCPCL